jgi:hypothetical protein
MHFAILNKFSVLPIYGSSRSRDHMTVITLIKYEHVNVRDIWCSRIFMGDVLQALLQKY